MSAMRNSTTNRNVFTALTLILMFLLADVFVPSAFPAPELLEEDAAIRKFFETKSQAGGISKVEIKRIYNID